jgi:hypothetical protein
LRCQIRADRLGPDVEAVRDSAARVRSRSSPATSVTRGRSRGSRAVASPIPADAPVISAVEDLSGSGSATAPAIRCWGEWHS